MKQAPVILCLVVGLSVQTKAQERTRPDFRKEGGYQSSGAAALPLLQLQQGYGMLLWLGSNATIGEGAFANFNPPNLVGCEYPVNSRIEHLYGAGIWVGAMVDTTRNGSGAALPFVTTGYDWGNLGDRHEMYGHQTDRDTFFTTSILNLSEPNRRGLDDDGDGRADEDELDGYDNDGDWVAASDDIGADGIPDSAESGCKGGYDPLRNPDPAYDNYSSTRYDTCHPNPTTGNVPRMTNRFAYTEKNGLADHGEPHVDEDYAAVSEHDVYVGYQDLYNDPITPGHYPLNIRVFQKSYAWRNFVKEPFIIMEYTIVNSGTHTLNDVYVGYFVDPLVGNIQDPDITNHKYVAYIPELRTGYANNGIDRPSTPIGVTVLGTPLPLEALRYTFSWNRFQDNPGTDAEHYTRMASGTIKPDQPIDSQEDTQFLFAFGPFSRLLPAQSLKVTVAVVSGDGVEVGQNPLTENAARALSLYQNGYRLPAVPPSPPLRTTAGEKKVTLNWKWNTGDPLFDPLESWDDSDAFLGSLPPAHWRRVNPPSGHATGGRNFEGFRIWRSEAPEYVPNSFSMVRQLDVDDDLNFEFGTGITYEFVDSGLNVGKSYWYSVTSFSTPKRTMVVIPDPGGGPPTFDTLLAPAMESDIGTNATRIQIAFSPSTRLGDVKVVPNPYRTDLNYSFEEGGWEGRSQFWTENERVIWFTHLPARALIRIFSLTGDIVATLHHDDGERTTSGKSEGQEEWNLLSDSGRAIASGIYIFTVESDYGQQVGKFAVIR